MTGRNAENLMEDKNYMLILNQNKIIGIKKLTETDEEQKIVFRYMQTLQPDSGVIWLTDELIQHHQMYLEKCRDMKKNHVNMMQVLNGNDIPDQYRRGYSYENFRWNIKAIIKDEVCKNIEFLLMLGKMDSNTVFMEAIEKHNHMKIIYDADLDELGLQWEEKTYFFIKEKKDNYFIRAEEYINHVINLIKRKKKKHGEVVFVPDMELSQMCIMQLLLCGYICMDDVIRDYDELSTYFKMQKQEEIAEELKEYVFWKKYQMNYDRENEKAYILVDSEFVQFYCEHKVEIMNRYSNGEDEKIDILYLYRIGKKCDAINRLFEKLDNAEKEREKRRKKDAILSEILYDRKYISVAL